MRVRALADTVGYAHTPQQMEAIIRFCDSLESTSTEEALAGSDPEPSLPWIAGICPHDDYLYAARLYADIMRNISASHVLIFGVAHRARQYDLADKLIFDSFDAWRGPYGPVRVSPLREKIIERLPAGSYTIHDEMQAVEHSVEGLVPFLQQYHRDVQVVSILVPYMNWERMDQLSRVLAEVLQSLMAENDLLPGRDIAFLCSNDCVHYGDQDWGGKNYAPFGADVDGYERAVQRDRDLIENYLIGKLSAERLRIFSEKLVDQDDVTQYNITWCGRFSVPFGLNCLHYLTEDLQRPPLKGYLLSYDTSVAAGELPFRELGLGTTAPSNFHHWVGYCAIGYR
jgi:AmmeMemoRadiSam system protein B